MNFEVEYIKKLIKVLSENDLSEISIEDKDEKTENKQVISIKRNSALKEAVVYTPRAQAVSQTEDATEQKEEAVINTEPVSGTAVVSPMTGTFYSSSSPDVEPFVKVGDVVSKGQVLCIVEAMKLMNEIEAEVSGKITKICVQNKEMVESGKVLMYIE